MKPYQCKVRMSDIDGDRHMGVIVDVLAGDSSRSQYPPNTYLSNDAIVVITDGKHKGRIIQVPLRFVEITQNVLL